MDVPDDGREGVVGRGGGGGGGGGGYHIMAVRHDNVVQGGTG